jgi:DMSO/TMAO reductase YedYZ heme-binding membrane subunit
VVTFGLGAAGPSAYWYLTRSSGAVSLVLLTASVVLGVLDVSRWQSASWPRFAVDALHRNVSTLAVVFLAVHVITSVLDSFAPIGVAEAFIPFIGSYRPLWLGLGAVALDLLVAVFLTSLLRHRVGYRRWRATHWLAYACWPIALIHGFGTGSDVKSAWLLVLSFASLLAVLASVGVRAIRGWPASKGVRAGAFVAAGALCLGVAIWLPGGPLGNGWARRAGTPLALLAASSSTHDSAKRPDRAQAAQPSPLEGPFQAQLSGTIKQEPGPGPGLVSVTLSTSLSGGASGSLRVQIEGQALEGGGVSLNSSHVTLGQSPSQSQYSGRIVQLQGNRIVATVRRADGRELLLDITLSSTPESGAVSGTVSAQPSRSAGSE